MEIIKQHIDHCSFILLRVIPGEAGMVYRLESGPSPSGLAPYIKKS